MQQIMQFLQSSTWNTVILITSMLKISETVHDVSKVCYFVQIMLCPLMTTSLVNYAIGCDLRLISAKLQLCIT